MMLAGLFRTAGADKLADRLLEPALAYNSKLPAPSTSGQCCWRCSTIRRQGSPNGGPSYSPIISGVGAKGSTESECRSL